MIVSKGNVYYDADLLDREFVFLDREDAGDRLGAACRDVFGGKIEVVYAIPYGGVPVGYRVSLALRCKFDLIICRKLLIPWNREAGFGAVAPDGQVYVDSTFASMLSLSKEEIEEAIREQVNEISRRNAVLRKNRDYSGMRGKRILLVDDGVAAGYTMMAAVSFAKRAGASSVNIAVPTGHMSTVVKLAKIVDKILCLNIRRGAIFAVADAYVNWADLSDEDIEVYLREL